MQKTQLDEINLKRLMKFKREVYRKQQIKFRVWHKNNMISFDEIRKRDLYSLIFSQDKEVRAMQSINFYDSKNVEIYEGDIVEVQGKSDYTLHVVMNYTNKNREPLFDLNPVLDNEHGIWEVLDPVFGYKIIVVGNIYEDKNILIKIIVHEGV